MIAFEQKANNNEIINWHWLTRPHRSIVLFSCLNQWVIHQFNCFFLVLADIAMVYLLAYAMCDSFTISGSDYLFGSSICTQFHLIHLNSSRAITNHSLTFTLRHNKTMQVSIGSRLFYYCTCPISLSLWLPLAPLFRRNESRTTRSK